MVQCGMKVEHRSAAYKRYVSTEAQAFARNVPFHEGPPLRYAQSRRSVLIRISAIPRAQSAEALTDPIGTL
jgi:hypothetical protein